MIGILCEKDSAMRNFSAALGGRKGSYQNEEYVIATARGHLYGFIQDPDKQVDPELASKYKSWSIKNLPWDENDIQWNYEKKPKTADVLKDIKDSLKDCDEICIATDDDPSGEGELLAWEIIGHLKLKVPRYTRMYFEDEAPASIQKAFKDRKLLGTDLGCMLEDPDYKKAQFRTKWDYLSMQWTRLAKAYSVGNEMPRQGRLKSAMVEIVGDQVKLCKEYVRKPFYQNRFQDENKVVYISKDEPSFDSPKEVPAAYTDSPVICDSKTVKYSIPPKYLDLASMSAALAARGYSSKTVLSTYQSMYESQVVSYPRTDDKVITVEQFYELLPLAEKIAQLVGVSPSILTHRKPRPTHVKAGGTHGANRPGPHVPHSLEELEKYGRAAKAIYTLLAKNYLATLAEDYKYELQKGHVQNYPQFEGSAEVPVFPGWKAVYSDVMADENEDENTQGLGTLAKPFVYEGANKKPQEPTMKWLMKQLEKYNVGTGATRTSIYSDISDSHSKNPLLADTKGKISMTKCGMISYALLPGTHISDLKMTEQVYAQMSEVASGKNDESVYLHQIQQMIIDDRETMQSNQRSHLKCTGDFQGNTILFNKVWGDYWFTDQECADLLAGKNITINYPDRHGKTKAINGNLQKQEYKGVTFYGFKSNAVLKPATAASDAFPAAWCGHAFTPAEIVSLKDGKPLEAEDFVSAKKAHKKFGAVVKYNARFNKISVVKFLPRS